jgi:glucokinase
MDNRMQGFAVGIDIGGTNLRAAVVDHNGHIVQHLRAASPIVDPHRGRIALLQAVHDVTAQANLQLQDLQGIGIGIPGWMDRVRGELVFAPKMAHWQDVFVLQDISRELGLPVFVDSDPNVATLGELWMGAGRGSRHLVMITLGTGLGCGIVIDGRLYAGAHGMSGEFGHIVVEAGSSELCDCGTVGCLETQAAGPAIARQGRRAVTCGEATMLRELAGGEAQAVTTAMVFAAAAQGDQAAGNIVSRAGELLGYGLATVVSLFEPEKIIVGGGMADVGELILRPMREAMETRCYLIARGYVQVEFVRAELGDTAGVIGAAHMAIWAGSSLYPNPLS